MSTFTPCGAKTRSGAACRRAPLAGRKRCRLHGGATPRGAASPDWRHGRHCRALRDFRRNWKASVESRYQELEARQCSHQQAVIEDIALRLAELEIVLFGEPRSAFELTLRPGELAESAVHWARRNLDTLLGLRHGGPAT